MIKKYLVALIAVLIIFTPAHAFAVEQGTTFDDGTSGGTYYEEPWQEPAYDNTYEEPGYEENFQNDGYQNDSAEGEGAWDNGYNGAEDNTYNDGYSEQYEEPEVYEEPYTEPYSEVYEEEYTEPEIYTEPAAEPETIEEPEEPEETEELSINAVKGEGHTVSGVVTENEAPAENVKLLLSAEDDSIEAVSNDKGEFTFTDVANGTYTLKAVDSQTYQAAAEPIEVKVENRNKLGYEIAVIQVEKEPETEEVPEETEEPEEADEALPAEAAETNQQASETSDGMSAFELILISGGTILLLAAIGIALFRKISAR